LLLLTKESLERNARHAHDAASLQVKHFANEPIRGRARDLEFGSDVSRREEARVAAQRWRGHSPLRE